VILRAGAFQIKFGNLFFHFRAGVIWCFSGDTATESQSISITVSPKQLDSQNACYIGFLEIHYPPFLFSPTTPSDSAWRTTTEGTYHDSPTNSPGHQILTHLVVCPATTQSRPTMSSCGFLKLSTEIHFEVFKYLDRVSSTCLGLTCKTFYPIHKKLHGIVRLDRVVFLPRSASWYVVSLGFLLAQWAGPDLYFDGWGPKFRKQEKGEDEGKGEEDSEGEEESD
jgi:hypothetical protein